MAGASYRKSLGFDCTTDEHCVDLYIHAYIQTLDNAHSSQAEGSNLRLGRSLGGKRTVDINDEQTGGFLNNI